MTTAEPLVLVVNRRPSVGGATLGEMLEDGVRLCYTLEDEIREVVGRPVSDWKVPHCTAIPSGRYPVVLQDSPRFGPDTLTVLDVPGFSYIRMHAGNTHEDTEGCLLLGLRAGAASLEGGTSRPAVALVKARVQSALKAGRLVYLELNNPTEVA